MRGSSPPCFRPSGLCTLFPAALMHGAAGWRLMGIETAPIRPVRVRMRPARRGWRRWVPPREVTVAAAVVMVAAALVAAAALREALALRRDALAGEQELRAARSVLERGTAGRTEFRLTLAHLDEARAHL